jgi:hypothetical protein
MIACRGTRHSSPGTPTGIAFRFGQSPFQIRLYTAFTGLPLCALLTSGYTGSHRSIQEQERVSR